MTVLSQMRRRAARLGAMSRDEVVDRVRQYATARLDAYRYKRGYDFAAECAGTPGLNGKFFFQSSELPGLCELLQRRFPAEAADTLFRAERICQHHFDLLGYEGLDYGSVIDWHLDLVHGKRGPRRPWFKVRYLDYQEVGDSKITWELNRQQHFVTLAKAYRLIGEEKFAQEIFAQWRHWQTENPYPIGMNWASSLEVAFRTLAWIWTYFLLEGTSVMTPEVRRDWLRALGLNGRHIETYLSTYFSPNTHLLGEGVALFFLGTLFPGLVYSKRWREKGWQVVVHAASRQVRADGFYFEQSTYYHVYALDLFLHARILAFRNGVKIPPEYDATLVKMLEALCLLGRAGIVPAFGDDDGGRLFDAQRNRTEHLLDPLSTGAVVFERPDFKFVAGTPREETLWLLGAEGLRVFDGMNLGEPSTSSASLRESGLYFLADADHGRQLLIDAGPQGPGTAGHGHADALSVSLVSGGRSLLIDPGTLEYIGADDKDRKCFRGTAAHNTMQVDGLDQAEGSGPFAWASQPVVTAERWTCGHAFDLFVGSHSGYQRLASPVTHQRWIFHRKAQFWMVRDVALGEGTHQMEISWRLGPTLVTASARDHVFGDEQESLGLLTPEGHGWSQSAHRANWSPAYGRQDRATVVTFGTTATLPAEFVTLLLPNARTVEGTARFERLAGQPAVTGYRYARSGVEHWFFFANSEGKWSLGAWSSDARFLYWSAGRNGERTLILCGGTYADAREAHIVSSDHTLEYVEIIESPENTVVFSSEPDRVQFQGPLERIDQESILPANDAKRIGV